MKNPRFYFSIVFLIVVLILAGAAYFQFVQGVEPCPLCILQRLAFIVIALILMVAIFHNPKNWGWCVYSVLVGLAALVGMYFSGYQIYLQHTPSTGMESCGPGLSILLQNLSFWNALREFFNGPGQCGVVTWQMFGLGFAAWAMIFFALIVGFSIWQFIKNKS